MTSPEFSASWLRQLRRRLCLTQTGFAHRYNISLRTIQKWEQGDRKPEGPALSFLWVISVMPEEVAATISKAPKSFQ